MPPPSLSWSTKSYAVTKQTASNYIPTYYLVLGRAGKRLTQGDGSSISRLVSSLLECKTQRQETCWLFSIAFFSFSGFLFISEFCVSIWFVVILKSKLRYLPLYWQNVLGTSCPETVRWWQICTPFFQFRLTCGQSRKGTIVYWSPIVCNDLHKLADSYNSRHCDPCFTV